MNTLAASAQTPLPRGEVAARIPGGEPISSNARIRLLSTFIKGGCSLHHDWLGRPFCKCPISEGGMIRLETFIELKFIDSSFLGLSSY